MGSQVHSYETATSPEINILSGSSTVRPADLPKIQADIICGLVLLEGSFPVGHLNPALHHFVHYAMYTKTHGPLKVYWMMAFERYNKHIKSHVKNPQQPEVNIAVSHSRESASHYHALSSGLKKPPSVDPHACVLWGKPTLYNPTREEVIDLRMSRCTVKDLFLQVRVSVTRSLQLFV